MSNHAAPTCTQCNMQSVLRTGVDIYPHRPDLASRLFYECTSCKARVGTHPGTDVPLGTLADYRTQQLRRQVHILLDQIWKNSRKKGARGAAYKFLAQALDIEQNTCHVGSFSAEQSLRAISVLVDHNNRRKAAKEKS